MTKRQHDPHRSNALPILKMRSVGESAAYTKIQQSEELCRS
jgi:hypothetical protein